MNKPTISPIQFKEGLKRVYISLKSKIYSHNTDKTSHNDIRVVLTEYVNLVNTILDSDDETLNQLSEIVAYIKSNRGLIDSVTTSKVNVSDIIDDLTTALGSKVLSANMGKVLNDKIETLKNSIGNIEGLEGLDDVYVMKEGDTEEDIPKDAVLVIYPDESPSDVIDWTNYYTKPEINEIIIRADFKKGKSAYEVAVEKGFEGTEEEWLQTLIGKSAYEIACELGFEGSSAEWVESLKPKKGRDYFDGKDGFTPTVSVEEIEGGINIKVTNIDGTDTSFIRDGIDGITPQRGEHYWTEEDIYAMTSAMQNYLDYAVASLVGEAPDKLNTLEELAKALNNKENFANEILDIINETNTKVASKVESETGKGLSTNDYTNGDKEKVDNLKAVATTGNFSDLTGRPTKLTDLANDGEDRFVKVSDVQAMLKDFADTYLAGRKIRVGNYTPETGYFTFKKKG